MAAHDGFTLSDTVSYAQKHNAANGEDNRDGHSANFSDNFGVEGATDDAEIVAARTRRRRNMIATLLLSQGTPMLLAGDEIGNGQEGNNNAYCQDSPLGWINWAARDDAFFGFCQQAIAFRKAHPILRQRRFLHSRSRLVDGETDLFWRREDGHAMSQSDWDDPARKVLVAELRMASGTPEYVEREGALLVVLNTGDAVDVAVSDTPAGMTWVRGFDTAQDGMPRDLGHWTIADNSVVVFVLAAITSN